MINDDKLADFGASILGYLKTNYWWYNSKVRVARTPSISRGAVMELLRLARDLGIDTDEYLNGE
jgi:hypothetical protein